MYKPTFDLNDVQVIDQNIVYQGFYKVERFKLQHRLFAGGTSKELNRELVHRLPAVAVLMYDADQDLVVLVEQFRVGAMAHESGPWQLEMVAGMIDTKETPEQVAVRECMEESGAIIHEKDLELVSKYLVTSGGSNEELSIYCAPVNASLLGGVFGLPTEGEDIKVHIIKREDFIKMLEQGQLSNAAIIIACQWLNVNYQRLTKQWANQ